VRCGRRRDQAWDWATAVLARKRYAIHSWCFTAGREVSGVEGQASTRSCLSLDAAVTAQGVAAAERKGEKGGNAGQPPVLQTGL
jgi:hypothetical protein